MLAVAACADHDGTTGPVEPPAITQADGMRGGRLYDTFWASETGWDPSDPNIAVFSVYPDFFRCQGCHGWDRLGSVGSCIGLAPTATRPNVASLNIARSSAVMTPQQLFDALKRSEGRRPLSADLSTYDPSRDATVGDMMPDLSEFMSDAAIWDLVKFLKDEAIDVDLLYAAATSGTYPTGSINFLSIGRDGDRARGDAIYAERCRSCHGADGQAVFLDGQFSVGSFVRDRPDRAQHVLKFGLLGTSMRGLVTDIEEMKDLYKALADEGRYPELAFVRADGRNGGRLYDRFWAAETGWDPNDPNIAIFSAFPEFFRCEACHGWDRLANSGAYIGRAPTTTRPNVSRQNLKRIAEILSERILFEAIKSPKHPEGRRSLSADLSTYDPVTNATEGDMMPDFGQFMGDEAIWDLVKFLKQEAVDTDELYDFSTSGAYPSGSITFSNIGKDGDAAAGDVLYATVCAGCHGPDGRAFPLSGAHSVGSFMRAQPHIVQHKVKFGQLGAPMGSLVTDLTDLKNLYKALTDSDAYPDP